MLGLTHDRPKSGHAAMAKALDRKPASREGLVRLSFRDAMGDCCRMFEDGGQAWTIRSHRAGRAA